MHVYLGPYLVIPPSQHARMHTNRSCTNRCAMPAIGKSAKFCSSCGGAVLEEQKPVIERRPTSINQLPAEWTDFMFSPEYGQNHPLGDVWLPNQRGFGLHIGRSDVDQFVPRPLENLDVDVMLAKATGHYSGLVQYLIDEFGVTPFWEVGVVAYDM